MRNTTKKIIMIFFTAVSMDYNEKRIREDFGEKGGGEREKEFFFFKKKKPR